MLAPGERSWPLPDDETSVPPKLLFDLVRGMVELEKASFRQDRFRLRRRSLLKIFLEKIGCVPKLKLLHGEPTSRARGRRTGVGGPLPLSEVNLC